MLDALPPDSDMPLVSEGEVSRLARRHGLETYVTAIRHVQGLPYGRTSGPDYRLVLIESRGTCSSKHALLAVLARENGLAVELVLGVYEMTGANTPGVGEELTRHGLSSIPEAHCYLRTDRGVIDVTMPEGSPSGAQRHFLHEEAIRPEDAGTYKISVHRHVVATWLYEKGHTHLGVDEAWTIREECIAALSRQVPASRQTG